MFRGLAKVCCLAWLASSAMADWPQFRGSDGNAVSDSTVPVSWSPTQNLAWKSELPGSGVSSPIVVGSRVIVTCYSGYGIDRQNPGEIGKLVRHVVCLDAESGKKLWQADVPAVQPEDPYTGIGVTAHGYASHTPVSDGKNVYVFFGKSGALAFDLNGKQLWQTPLGDESDPWKWGSSSSPILAGDVLVVTASAESQSIVGLDTKTGKQLWKQEASGLDGMWSTPVLVKTESGRQDLVLCVPKEMWGLDPQTGKLVWFSKATDADQSHATPFVNDGIVYAVTGRGGGSVAIRVGGSGEVTDTNTVWNGRETSRFASPVGLGSRLFVVGGDVLTVIDQATGERIKQVRFQGGSGRGGGRGGMGGGDYPSPVIAGKYLYYLKGNGEVFVFDVSADVEQLSVNLLTSDQESFGGTPAISESRFFARSNKHLYCVALTSDDVEPNVSQTLIAKLAENTGPDGGSGRGGSGGRAAGPGEGRGFDPAAFFARLDTNSDGKISKNEMEGNPMADRFDQLDKDKDAAVTLQEFSDGMREFAGGRAGFGGGRSGRGPGGRDSQDNRPKRPQRPTAFSQ